MCRDTAAHPLAAATRPAASRALAAARTPTSTGDLVKLAHGYLARQVAGDAAAPLDPAGWSTGGFANVALSGPGATDSLGVSGPDQAKVYIATLDAVGVRGEVMLYAIMSGGDTNPEIHINLFPTLIAMASPADYSPALAAFLLGRYRLNEDPLTDNDRLLIAELDGGTTLAGNARVLSPLKRGSNEEAWLIFWAEPGGDYALFDGKAAEQDNSIFERLGAHGRSSGLIGVGVTGTSSTATNPTTLVNQFWAVAGRYVSVLDVPAGAVARVLDGSGAELATGAEAGGEIAVDMMVLGDQVNDPDPVTTLPRNPGPDEAVTLRLEDAAGELLAVTTPEGATAGVWGGDVYSFAECT